MASHPAGDDAEDAPTDDTRHSDLVTLEAQVSPRHLAVLVVDMQNDFCAENGYLHRIYGIDLAARRRIADRIMEVVHAARTAGAHVTWIRAIYDEPHLSDSYRARIRRNRHGDLLCIEGTWGADFYEHVRPAAGEPVIAKHHYSAFHDTGLTDHLKARGIRTVAVTGVATNVCVESTLRDAFFDGFHVVVPRDCVGADDPDLHHASLRTVDSYFGYVTDADTLIALMGNARKETAPTGI